jgi:hypothetical protein
LCFRVNAEATHQFADDRIRHAAGADRGRAQRRLQDRAALGRVLVPRTIASNAGIRLPLIVRSGSSTTAALLVGN